VCRLFHGRAWAGVGGGRGGRATDQQIDGLKRSAVAGKALLRARVCVSRGTLQLAHVGWLAAVACAPLSSLSLPSSSSQMRTSGFPSTRCESGLGGGTTRSATGRRRTRKGSASPLKPTPSAGRRPTVRVCVRVLRASVDVRTCVFYVYVSVPWYVHLYVHVYACWRQQPPVL
jgi:hypothetical protein